MLHLFNLKITRAARLVLPPSKRGPVLDELGRMAEACVLGDGESAIFDIHDYGLKAVVNFHERTLWILTPDEYRGAGLPEPPSPSG